MAAPNFVSSHAVRAVVVTAQFAPFVQLTGDTRIDGYDGYSGGVTFKGVDNYAIVKKHNKDYGAVSSVTRDSTGLFTINLREKYANCMFASASVQVATDMAQVPPRAVIEDIDLANKLIKVAVLDGTSGARAEFQGPVVHVLLVMDESTVGWS